MHLRSAAAALTMAMALAACTAAEDTGIDRADGSRSVEEATADPADDGTRVDEVDEEEAVADGADDAGPEEPGAEPATVEALWWTAPTVDDGAEFASADLAGDKVVLWMWAPWCSVCNREAPDVARALADLPDDVTLIGVAGRDDVGPMREFVAEHGLEEMTHVVDDDGTVWASYGISYQPAWVFIDGDGSASVAAGALGYDGLFEGIDEVFDG